MSTHAFCLGRISVVESICSITAGPTILSPTDKSSLTKILQREKGRLNLYKQTIKWLPVRIQLDLNGFEDMDVFSHS